jgi:hypothetical protein
MDLFTQISVGRFCLHKKTQTVMLIKKSEWFRGELDYNVLVPGKDEKGKVNYCSATYTENEIELLDLWIEIKKITK